MENAFAIAFHTNPGANKSLSGLLPIVIRNACKTPEYAIACFSSRAHTLPSLCIGLPVPETHTHTHMIQQPNDTVTATCILHPEDTQKRQLFRNGSHTFEMTIAQNLNRLIMKPMVIVHIFCISQRVYQISLLFHTAFATLVQRMRKKIYPNTLARSLEC